MQGCVDADPLVYLRRCSASWPFWAVPGALGQLKLPELVVSSVLAMAEENGKKSQVRPLDVHICQTNCAA